MAPVRAPNARRWSRDASFAPATRRREGEPSGRTALVPEKAGRAIRVPRAASSAALDEAGQTKYRSFPPLPCKARAAARLGVRGSTSLAWARRAPQGPDETR